MFNFLRKHPSPTIPFDKANQRAVLHCSICTGEQIAGFKDIHTGHFTEVMLIKGQTDLERFMEMYDIAEVAKEY